MDNDSAKYIDFIEWVEKDFSSIGDELLTRVCERAIRAMLKSDRDSNNGMKNWRGSLWCADDYPGNLHFFDILSIQYQSRCLEEINPLLEDAISDALSVEYDKLPKIEKLAIEYSDCSEILYGDCKPIANRLITCFCELLNYHYSTSKKIENYLLSSCL